MGALQFRKISRENIDPALIEKAKVEFSRMPGFRENGTSPESARIFYFDRDVHRKGRKRECHAFLAVSEAMLERIERATSTLSDNGLEHPLRIRSNCYSSCGSYLSRRDSYNPDRHPRTGPEYHFAYLGDSSEVLFPVALESGGYTINGGKMPMFRRLVYRAVNSLEGEAALENLRSIISIVKQEILPKADRCAFVLSGEKIWEPESESGSDLKDLAEMISERGLVGKGFGFIPKERHSAAVYLDFHGHPGAAEGLLPVPPSIIDIESSAELAIEGHSRAEICFQTLAIRERNGSFRFFIRPLFRSEDSYEATTALKRIRLAYLNEYFNTHPEAEFTIESHALLFNAVQGSDALGENKDLADKLEEFRSALMFGPDDPAGNKARWDSIVSSICSETGSIPVQNWRESLWTMGGLMLEPGMF